MDEQNQVVEQSHEKGASPKYLPLVIGGAVVLLAGGWWLTTNKQTAAKPTINLKDGTYTAEGDYRSPGGDQKITVTLTIKDNVIADATAVNGGIDPRSQGFQDMFIANFKPMVVGKNVNEVRLDKVSGSSLTPKGFMDALTKIEAQAQS